MPTNRQILLPYALPYLGYVAVASMLGGVLPVEANYLLRIVVVVGLLYWGRHWFCSVLGPGSPAVSVAVGVVGGLVGVVLWIGLLSPFVGVEVREPWTTGAFLLRLTAAGLLVPVFEELLMRGFIFRLALQWDQARRDGDPYPLQTALDERNVDAVPAGAWTWPAVLISTVVFTVGHQLVEWPASVAYGLLMCLLWALRKDLLCCIVAHGVTNIALAGYVVLGGNWQYW